MRRCTGAGAAAQEGVVIHHAGQRVIVPAVDEQCRHRPFRQQRPEVHRIPKGIPGAAVSELVPVELQVDTREPANHLTERQVVEARLQLGHAPLDALGRDVGVADRAGLLVELGCARVPRDDHLEGQRGSRIPRVGPYRGRQGDCHCVEVRRLGGGQRPLGEAHVATAERTHAAVEPGLGGDPVRCVPSVQRFGEVAVRATRPVRAPAGLQDVPVAAGGELRAHGRGEVDPAVRRALQDGRGVVDAHGVVDVGQQHRPIRRRDLDVPLDVDFVGALPHCDPFATRASGSRRRQNPMPILLGLESRTLHQWGLGPKLTLTGTNRFLNPEAARAGAMGGMVKRGDDSL